MQLNWKNINEKRNTSHKYQSSKSFIIYEAFKMNLTNHIRNNLKKKKTVCKHDLIRNMILTENH